jgi:hypothetical protein
MKARPVYLQRNNTVCTFDIQKYSKPSKACHKRYRYHKVVPVPVILLTVKNPS